MNMWTAIMVIAIVAITSLARIARVGLQAKHGIITDRKGRVQALLNQPPPQDSELQREVLELRERIKVLERIATDGRQSQAIADEIESLRDR